MSKYYISELDRVVNKNKTMCFDVALQKVQNYIKKTIDPSFSESEFEKWCNSDSEKPFKWNKNTYYWGD